VWFGEAGKMKLAKEDWNQLDTLLSKMGFGGYYDCIEVLRMAATNLTEDEKIKHEIQREDDLVALILLIEKLSHLKRVRI